MAEYGEELDSVLQQKALELFKECDSGSKGYLTRSDFALLNAELQLSDEAISQVFDSLAENKDGVDIISSDCFVAGFGAFLRCAGRRLSTISANGPATPDPYSAENQTQQSNTVKMLSGSQEDFGEAGLFSPVPYDAYSHQSSRIPDDCESGVSSTGHHAVSLSSGYEIDSSEWDPAFSEMLHQLTANGIEPQEDGFAELWQRLEREDPHMLPTFEKFLRKVNGELSQTKSYCRSLALMLRQKVAEHDETITSLHDELEDHVRQEAERIVAAVRAHEAQERKLLERELDEREHHQNELRVRLAMLEARERELNRLVEASITDRERLESEKEALEIALRDRSSADVENFSLNERIRTINKFQQESATEIGGLKAERDVLAATLDEMTRRNALLQSERHTLSSPLLLNNSTPYRRRPSATLPTPLLMMPNLPSHFSHHSGTTYPFPPATPLPDHQHQIYSHPHRPSSSRSSTPLGYKSDVVSSSSCADHNSLAATSCDGSCAIKTSSQQHVYASNQSLETIVPSVRATSVETITTEQLPASTNNGNETSWDNKIPEVPGNPKALYKIVFLGDSGVGKTAILHRLCYDQFRPAFNATIGMDLHLYPVGVSDNSSVMLQLWDTAGQERYRSMTRQYFRNANAFVLVYDIMCEASFLSCRWWLEEIDNVVTSKANLQTMLLLGNKVDVASNNRAVSLEQAKSLAMERGMMFAEVSAQTGLGVREVVNQLAVHLARDTNITLRRSSSRDDASCQANLVTLSKPAGEKEKSGCFSCGN